MGMNKSMFSSAIAKPPFLSGRQLHISAKVSVVLAPRDCQDDKTHLNFIRCGRLGQVADEYRPVYKISASLERVVAKVQKTSLSRGAVALNFVGHANQLGRP